jgi:hypothetical protein
MIFMGFPYFYGVDSAQGGRAGLPSAAKGLSRWSVRTLAQYARGREGDEVDLGLLYSPETLARWHPSMDTEAEAIQSSPRFFLVPIKPGKDGQAAISNRVVLQLFLDFS